MFELAILIFLLAVLSQFFIGSLILLNEIRLSFWRLTITNVSIIGFAILMAQFLIPKVKGVSCAPPQVVTMILGIVAIEIQLFIMALQIAVVELKSPQLTEEAMSRL
jgi:hypothetical protein